MIIQLVQQWFNKAEADLVTVKILLKDPEHNTGIVCFHCQQAVEKYLKGYLSAKNIEFPKTHDLITLYDLCIKTDKDFQLLDKYKLTTLTYYSVENRYPDEQYTPTAQETEEFTLLAKQTKEFVLKKVK